MGFFSSYEKANVDIVSKLYINISSKSQTCSDASTENYRSHREMAELPWKDNGL